MTAIEYLLSVASKEKHGGVASFFHRKCPGVIPQRLRKVSIKQRGSRQAHCESCTKLRLLHIYFPYILQYSYILASFD